MGALAGKLQATPLAPAVNRAKTSHPKGWEPGYEFTGAAGWINTGPLTDRPKTWDAFIKDSGLDPEEVEVLEPVNVRGWDAQQKGGNVVRMHYYRLNVRRRTLKLDLDELVKAARRKVTKPVKRTADAAFMVALGDLQLGKVDGDGVEGTVTRFYDKTAAAVARYKQLAKAGRVGPIYLIHLGDCIEGFVSQGGANTYRTTLTTTEQVRLYRRLLIDQIKAFAPLTDNLVMCGVPGNHDEALRPLQSYGDSWAIESVAAVKDALDLAGNYEHVHLHAPARDELTLTLDVCGTVVGMCHGHQFRPDYRKWWQGQQMGRQPIGDADLLLAGHKHHLRIEREARSFIQVPALESESTWFRHTQGGVSEPGIVTAVVGGGRWASLEVL